MLADASAELRDSSILENFTTSDFDPATVRLFRQLFISSKPDHPWHALDGWNYLKKFGAYRIDRKTKQEGITCGLLMFGKSDSIKDQDQLPDFWILESDFLLIPRFVGRTEFIRMAPGKQLAPVLFEGLAKAFFYTAQTFPIRQNQKELMIHPHIQPCVKPL